MTITIKQEDARQWKARWERLSSDQFKNEYGIAELAFEVRREFPDGDSGDLQFRVFVKRHLKGCQSKTFLEKAKAFGEFDAKQWHRLGGWQGVSFLTALTRTQRYRVIAALHGDGPFHYSTIRVRALKLGIVSKRKGRDTRTRSEQKIAILRQFIVDLYKKRSDLPALSESVKLAMSPTLLSTIAAGARA